MPGRLQLKPEQHTFYFARRPARRKQSMNGEAVREVCCRAGDYGVLPANFDFQADYSAPESFIVIEAPDSLVRNIAYETVAPDRIEVLPVHASKDPVSLHYSQLIESIATTPPDQRHGLDVDGLVLSMAKRIMAVAGIDPMKGAVPHRHGLQPAALAMVRDYIEANAHRALTLAELAGVATLSVFHFSRAFALSMGVTPMRYVWHRRIERAKDALRDPRGDTLACIALDCGFASQSHFNDAFRRETGSTPGAYRRASRTIAVAILLLTMFAVDILIPDRFWMVLTTHVQAASHVEMICCH